MLHVEGLRDQPGGGDPHLPETVGFVAHLHNQALEAAALADFEVGEEHEVHEMGQVGLYQLGDF